MSTKVYGETAYQLLTGYSADLTEQQASILMEEYGKIGLRFHQGSHKGKPCLFVRASARQFEDFESRRLECWQQINHRAGVGMMNSRSNTYRPGVDRFVGDSDWNEVVSYIESEYSKLPCEKPDESDAKPAEAKVLEPIGGSLRPGGVTALVRVFLLVVGVNAFSIGSRKALFLDGHSLWIGALCLSWAVFLCNRAKFRDPFIGILGILFSSFILLMLGADHRHWNDNLGIRALALAWGAITLAWSVRNLRIKPVAST